MKVSIVKKNINPMMPSYLSGQINRHSKHTGILDDIYCTVLIIEHNETKLCLLAYDLLQFDAYLSNRIRERVENAIGINQATIYTVPSHTHAGPEVLKDGLFGIKTETTVADGYLDFLVDMSAEAAIIANQTLINCQIEYAEIEIEGFYGNRNNIHKKSDKSMRFLVFRSEEKMVGLFVNVSCHPTILGAQNTQISSDLIGKIRSGLELSYQCPVFMSNGAEGDISNRHYRLSHDAVELERTGNGILAQIPKPLNLRLLDINQIDVYHKTFIFKCFNDTKRIQSVINQNDIKMKNNSNSDTLKILNATNTVLKHRLNTKIESELEIDYSIINLGSCVILSIPLELFSSLFLKLKESIALPIILLGLTNTSMGYCVDRESFDDTYEGLTSPFIKGEGERFIESIRNEIKQLS